MGEIMKKIILLFVFVLVTGSLFAQVKEPQYAVGYTKEHWESWSRETKVDFVAGFAACFHSMVLELAKNATDANSQNYVLFVNESLTGLTLGEIVDGVDALYETGHYDDVLVAGMILNIKDLVWRETNDY
jgi:hypothetical protein